MNANPISTTRTCMAFLPLPGLFAASRFGMDSSGTALSG
jgi:hypothetical protein